jgi:hypothetical protein
MRLRWPTLLAFAVLAGCARLDIPSIGLHEQVIPGDQPQIDAGHVDDITRLPGIWLAGHRTEDGAVFRNLPNLRPGDPVCLTGAPGTTVCWHVVLVMVVSTSSQPPAEGLGPLILQTSWPGDRNLLVICA